MMQFRPHEPPLQNARMPDQRSGIRMRYAYVAETGATPRRLPRQEPRRASAAGSTSRAAAASATPSSAAAAAAASASAAFLASASAFLAKFLGALGLLGGLRLALGLALGLGFGHGGGAGCLPGGFALGNHVLRGAELVGEALDASASVNELLLPGVERVAGAADVDLELGLRGTRRESVAAAALHRALQYSGWIPCFMSGSPSYGPWFPTKAKTSFLILAQAPGNASILAQSKRNGTGGTAAVAAPSGPGPFG